MANEVYKNDANLQGLWLLEETSGTRYDYTANNNDLTDNNTVGYSADSQQGDYSADFEKNNSEYLSITDGSQTGLDITGNLTIVFWYKPESLSAVQQLVTKYNTSSQRAYRISTTTTHEITAILSNNGTSITQCKGATTLSTATWYHVAMVYNGTDIRVYLDGSLDTNGADNPKTYSSGIYNSTAAFCIGVQDGGSLYADGLLDEVAIFDRALSADEIASIYNYGIQDPVSGDSPWYIYSQQ